MLKGTIRRVSRRIGPIVGATDEVFIACASFEERTRLWRKASARLHDPEAPFYLSTMRETERVVGTRTSVF